MTTRLLVCTVLVFLRTSNVLAQVTTEVIPYTLTDRSATTFETIGGDGNTVAGYARIQPAGGSTTPTGMAIVGLRTNGVLVTEAALAANRSVLSGRTYAELSGDTNTGIAIANLNDLSITVSFLITGSAGNTIRQGTFTLRPREQISRFVDQSPFNAAGFFTGTLSIEASLPVAVTALRGLVNERGEFLMTPQALASGFTTAVPVLIGHFADGGGWRTRLLLVNPTDATIMGTVQFFGQGSGVVPGSALTINVNGSTGASFTYTIPPRASSVLLTGGLGTGAQVGSIRITPSGGTTTPSAFAVFSLRNGEVTISEFSVTAEPTAFALRMYVESSRLTGGPGAIQSAFAISNTSSTTATVSLELLNQNGTGMNLTATRLVPANGHISIFVTDVFPAIPTPATGVFRGVLRMTSGATPLAVVGVRARYNERGEFLATATPVSNEAAPSTSAESIFPQVVDLGGYQTQFVLFSGVSGQTSNGVVRFFAQSGETLDLKISGPQ